MGLNTAASGFNKLAVEHLVDLKGTASGFRNDDDAVVAFVVVVVAVVVVASEHPGAYS